MGLRPPWPGLGDPNVLDPGIRDAVVLLNQNGITTFESCEGGTGHAYHEPTVRFEGTEQTLWVAYELFREHRLPVRRMSMTYSASEIDDRRSCGQEDGSPFCEITFRPDLQEKT